MMSGINAIRFAAATTAKAFNASEPSEMRQKSNEAIAAYSGAQAQSLFKGLGDSIKNAANTIGIA